MEEFKLGAAIPQLPSGDLKKTAEFFKVDLGFEIITTLPDFLIVRKGAAEIHFWKVSSEEEAKALGSNSSCYIRVENIPALFHHFKDRQVRFRYEPTKQPWGMHEMQIDDPYGNAIRFGEEI